MALDLKNAWPFNKIQSVTVDGQAMIRLPKMYVNNTKLVEGPYAGKYQYSIAPDKIDDNWHVHPAFMNKGKEMSAVDIGAYLASKDSAGKAASIKNAAPWTSITRDTAHSLGANRNVAGGSADKQGWHCYNIFEHHLIARLMLIEYGSSDLQTLLTGSTSGMGANYHGIADVWGANDYGEWFDGVDTLGPGNTVRIFDNDGGQTYVNTGITPCGSNWLLDTLHDKGTGFDLGDVFLASKVGSQTDGSYGDSQNFNGGYVFYSHWGTSEYRGPFYLNSNTSSDSYSALGFRLAHYVE